MLNHLLSEGKDGIENNFSLFASQYLTQIALVGYRYTENVPKTQYICHNFFNKTHTEIRPQFTKYERAEGTSDRISVGWKTNI